MRGGMYPFGIGVLLRNVHGPRRRSHHVCHAVHGIVGLDLRGRQLGHVGHLIHLLGEGLLGEQHLGLLVGLLRLALFEQLLDLLLEDGVLLGGLLGLAPGLLGLEAGLELDVHVAGHLSVGHVGRWDDWGGEVRRGDDCRVEWFFFVMEVVCRLAGCDDCHVS